MVPKIVCIVSLFAVGFVGYLLSLKMKGSKLLFDCGNALAAGIILSGGLLHLMPHAAHYFADWKRVNDVTFPVSELLVGSSFVFLVLLEKASTALLLKSGKNGVEEESKIYI